MIVRIEVDYTLGQTVYLACDDEPRRGLVTGYQVRAERAEFHLRSTPLIHR